MYLSIRALCLSREVVFFYSNVIYLSFFFFFGGGGDSIGIKMFRTDCKQEKLSVFIAKLEWNPIHYHQFHQTVFPDECRKHWPLVTAFELCAYFIMK